MKTYLKWVRSLKATLQNQHVNLPNTRVQSHILGFIQDAREQRLTNRDIPIADEQSIITVVDKIPVAGYPIFGHLLHA